MVVLIPAYEPDHRLLRLISSLLAAAPGVDIVVVDDGSGRAYRPLFDAARRLGCVVLGHKENLGKGRALKTGFDYLDELRHGEDIVCADADGQHRARDILAIAERVRRSGRVVLGARAATIYLERNASSHFRPAIDSARVYAPLLTFSGSSLLAFAVDVIVLLAVHAMTGLLLPVGGQLRGQPAARLRAPAGRALAISRGEILDSRRRGVRSRLRPDRHAHRPRSRSPAGQAHHRRRVVRHQLPRPAPARLRPGGA